MRKQWSDKIRPGTRIKIKINDGFVLQVLVETCHLISLRIICTTAIDAEPGRINLVQSK